jgi:hypothetical protein
MQLTRVRRSRAYHVLVAIGLVSYGLVHLVVAWIAIQVAFGKKGDASPVGALQTLAKQPLGEILLWVMAVGLFTLTAWQVIDAIVGRDTKEQGESLKERARCAGRSVVYLGLGLLTAGVALGRGGHSGQGEQTVSAKLMAVPFGRVLVGLLGAGVVAVGVGQIVKGVKKNFLEDLDQGVGKPTRWLGTVGYIAKGISLTIIGLLFGWAALTYDAKKAGGMDAALTTIRDQPFGPVLLTAMAAGLACFGLYCFAWARFARY